MQIRNYTLGSRGLRLALLADLHNRPYGRILNAVAEAAPDLIAVAGDLTYGREQFHRVAGFLQQCGQIAPTYLSLGNHDRLDCICSMDIGAAHLLDNDYIDTTVRGVDLRIGGLSSPSSQYCGVNALLDSVRENPREPYTQWLDGFCQTSACKILLCHQPEFYPRYLQSLPLELVLSGHAHGGQWRIPFTQQGVYAPGQGLLPKLTGGLAQENFVISRGLSNTTWIPRFFNPREIVFVDL